MIVKQQIGEWYDAVEPKRESDACQAYGTIAEVNRDLYDRIPVPVVWTYNDPYDSYQEMKTSVNRDGCLWVFTGGSADSHVSEIDNVKGRAVHDWFGHLSNNCDFSMKGEWQKFNHVKCQYPEWTHPILFTEVVGQRAAVSYYDGFSDPRFEQKAVFAPKHIMEMARKAYGE